MVSLMVMSKGSGLGNKPCKSQSLDSADSGVSYIIHYRQSIYIIQSVQKDLHKTKQTINYPASQQAASHQATRTSAAASAARSKVSILLRTQV